MQVEDSQMSLAMEIRNLILITLYLRLFSWNFEPHLQELCFLFVLICVCMHGLKSNIFGS